MNTSRESAEPFVLPLEGRLDALTTPALDIRLQELVQARTLILDLAHVTYISSSGFRVLLLAQRRQQSAGGKLVLRNLSPKILRVLQLAGFDRIFQLGPPSTPKPAQAAASKG